MRKCAYGVLRTDMYLTLGGIDPGGIEIPQPCKLQTRNEVQHGPAVALGLPRISKITLQAGVSGSDWKYAYGVRST